MEYRSSRNVVFSCKYHIVWCPKYRRRLIVGAIERRLKELIAETLAAKDAVLIEIETMPDHVHLLVDVDPQFGVHRLVKALKGRTSKILRDEFPELKTRLAALWTNSYFVSTVGGAPLDAVKRYIESQKKG